MILEIGFQKLFWKNHFGTKGHPKIISLREEWWQDYGATAPKYQPKYLAKVFVLAQFIQFITIESSSTFFTKLFRSTCLIKNPLLTCGCPTSSFDFRGHRSIFSRGGRTFQCIRKCKHLLCIFSRLWFMVYRLQRPQQLPQLLCVLPISLPSEKWIKR